MRVAIFGGSGQLGRTLRDEFPKRGMQIEAPSSLECDITSVNSVDRFFSNKSFDVVVNCAAWTNVDDAEDFPDECFKINSLGARYLAQVCRTNRTKLVQISTDYVFDGTASHPYLTTDMCFPLGVYGKSKLEGEKNVLETYKEGTYVVRTAWLYSKYGNNFVKSIVRRALTSSPLSVVSDCWGQPTSAIDLSHQIVKLLENSAPVGIYHGTNSGKASWYDFAKAILEEGGFDSKLEPRIGGESYGKAKRPRWSVLDHSNWSSEGLPSMRPWREALADNLNDIVSKVRSE